MPYHARAHTHHIHTPPVVTPIKDHTSLLRLWTRRTRFCCASSLPPSIPAHHPYAGSAFGGPPLTQLPGRGYVVDELPVRAHGGRQPRCASLPRLRGGALPARPLRLLSCVREGAPGYGSSGAPGRGKLPAGASSRQGRSLGRLRLPTCDTIRCHMWWQRPDPHMARGGVGGEAALASGWGSSSTT